MRYLNLKAAGRQVLDLFIVDVRFTGALALWVAGSACVPVLFHGQGALGAVVFFGGFAAILVENVVYVASRPLVLDDHRL